MDEKENQQPSANNDAGVQHTADERIERANKASQRLEEATKRAEAIKVNEILGGRSEGGKPAEKPKELSPREYAQLALKGIVPKR